MPSTRRVFLTTCGLTVTAGCLGRGGRSTPYQLVAGVEWKTIRGTRDNTIEKIAQNDPIDGPVGDGAPRDLAVRTTAYDDTVVDLSGRGPLILSEATIDRIEGAYTDPYAVVVLTVYNDDPYNDIPNGNSFGYRATFDQFNRVNPGNRISATINRDRDVPALGDLLTVDFVRPEGRDGASNSRQARGPH
jgi:hypothetical protein